MIKSINVVLYVREDFWGRKIYRNTVTGILYADVDGVLHTMTADGKPCCPLKKDIKIKYLTKG